MFDTGLELMTSVAGGRRLDEPTKPPKCPSSSLSLLLRTLRKLGRRRREINLHDLHVISYISIQIYLDCWISTYVARTNQYAVKLNGYRASHCSFFLAIAVLACWRSHLLIGRTVCAWRSKQSWYFLRSPRQRAIIVCCAIYIQGNMKNSFVLLSIRIVSHQYI